MKNLFAGRIGIIAVGAFIGIVAALLQFMGNPPNMGVCVACFERDIVGALGWHRAGVVQYLRPEIFALVIGSFIASLFAKETSARGGSSPILRFLLGIFAMIGALVFLGCPWRALLRLAGGDGNAILGILGLIVGIFVGTLFLKNGFSLGRAYKNKKASAWFFPALMLGLLALAIFTPKFGEQAIFSSEKGPGSMHAPLIISALAGLFIGMVAQRSRFCTMGAFRDLFIVRDFHLLSGVLSLVLFAGATNMLLGQFHPGFVGQPIAHTDGLWNFLGMVLSGLAFVLAGGCPGRQLILAGEGDSDSAVFVMGMFAGAAVSHNFMLASTPAGITAFAPYAVILGIIFCLIVGFAMRTKFEMR